MKIYENKYFNSGLLLIFFILLTIVGMFGCVFGIIEIPNLIASSILMLLSPFFAVSFPIYAAYKNEEKKTALESSRVYRTVASYVGGEILDNKIEIQDILRNNEKTFDMLESSSPSIQYQKQTSKV